MLVFLQSNVFQKHSRVFRGCSNGVQILHTKLALFIPTDRDKLRKPVEVSRCTARVVLANNRTWLSCGREMLVT